MIDFIAIIVILVDMFGKIIQSQLYKNEHLHNICTN